MAETIKKQFSLIEILNYTGEKRATDVHICVGKPPLYRYNSNLITIDNAPSVTPDMIDQYIKEMLDDKKITQLKEKKVLDFSFSLPGIGRFRVNIYSQRGTFAIAIRTLPFQIPSLKQLGLPQSVEQLTKKNRGLILATGATGSGKSTTLASLIKIINENYNYHIITIEDPIEYLHPHQKSLVTQREIGSDATSFADALRSALREDPDIIMVGEMRDPETISIALTAAETGHLVFSTLHTMGAAKSIDRIIDAFPAGQQFQIRNQLAAVLEGVVSQQLIPSKKDGQLTVAYELMIPNPAIRNMIRESKNYQINNIMQTGLDHGMQLMDAHLVALYRNDIISLEEAHLRALDQDLLEYFLSRS